MQLSHKPTLDRSLPWILTIGGGVGFLCSLILVIEKIALLKDPSAKAPCDLSPIISCGSVMNSPQTEIFGIPNPLLGVALYAALAMFGILLMGTTQLKRWLWLGLQAGLTLGILFVHWLIFQSLYVLGTLCPFCMTVWVVTITMFWYTTLYNLRTGRLPRSGRLRQASSFAQRHHVDILLSWLLIIVALILHRFWYYFGDLL